MRRIGRLEVSLAGLGCNNFGCRLDAGAAATAAWRLSETELAEVERLPDGV